MKVYIVCTWEDEPTLYNNPNILAGLNVFSTQEKAQSYIDKQEHNELIMYELDEYNVD